MHSVRGIRSALYENPLKTFRLLPFMKSILTFVGVIGLSLASAFAGVDVSKEVVTTKAAFYPFEKGTREVELTSGWFHSDILATSRPTFEFEESDLSYGWMLNSPHGSGFFRGNCELLLSAFGSFTTSSVGPSGVMVGGRLKLRYNFVQENARIVPFVELGAGGLGDDIYLDQTQRVIGSGFEFNLEAGAGVRFLICDHWAFSLMSSFEHISNAGTAARNLGANALGGRAGFSYFY